MKLVVLYFSFFMLLGCTTTNTKTAPSSLLVNGSYESVFHAAVQNLKKCKFKGFLSRLYDDNSFGEIIFETTPSPGFTIGSVARNQISLEVTIEQTTRSHSKVIVSNDKFLNLIKKVFLSGNCDY